MTSEPRINNKPHLVPRHGRLKSLKSRLFVKRFEVLAELVMEGGAVIFSTSRGEFGREFVTGHDLVMLIFQIPLAGFDLLAHQMISMTVFSCQG